MYYFDDEINYNRNIKVSVPQIKQSLKKIGFKTNEYIWNEIMLKKDKIETWFGIDIFDKVQINERKRRKKKE